MWSRLSRWWLAVRLWHSPSTLFSSSYEIAAANQQHSMTGNEDWVKKLEAWQANLAAKQNQPQSAWWSAGYLPMPQPEKAPAPVTPPRVTVAADAYDVMLEQLEWLIQHSRAGCESGCTDCGRLARVKEYLLTPFV